MDGVIMSELSELKKAMTDGFSGIHRRLDDIQKEHKETEIKLATHLGNPGIHTEPPCAGFQAHVDNHKDNKSTWLVGIGIVMSGLGFIAYIAVEALRGIK